MKSRSWCILFLGGISLLGCGVREGGLAPVEESKWREARPTSRHIVRPGETLYAIAFRYDQDYHTLASLNRLKPPYTLRVGQVVHLKPNPQLKKLAAALPDLPRLPSSNQWLWPTRGRVETSFSPQKGQKGIEVAGRKGQKIYASASGTVAYAGNGLPGYGNLIILKHDSQYLTAYGNNQRNLVHEGQVVKKGQVIAEMGLVNRRFWGLHFEIRKMGEPVNPLNYLSFVPDKNHALLQPE